jgi:hypothetical protein
MKPKNSKLLQDFHELQYSTHRPIPTAPDALFLLRLRSRLGVPQPARRRFAIKIAFKNKSDFHAQAMKITHL